MITIVIIYMGSWVRETVIERNRISIYFVARCPVVTRKSSLAASDEYTMLNKVTYVAVIIHLSTVLHKGELPSANEVEGR